jgi:hypothetical protein
MCLKRAYSCGNKGDHREIADETSAIELNLQFIYLRNGWRSIFSAFIRTWKKQRERVVCRLSPEGLELRFFGDSLVALARTLDAITRHTAFFGKQRHDFIWSTRRIDTAMPLQLDKLPDLEPVLGHVP